MHQLQPQTRKSQANAIFVNISSKVYFILKSYVRQSSQVDQNFVEFLSCRVRSSFPEQGVTSHIFNSAEVRCFTHERSYPCYQPGAHTRPHFLWCGVQYKTQANHCPSPPPRTPTLLYSEGPRSLTNLERLTLDHDTIHHRPQCTYRPTCGPESLMASQPYCGTSSTQQPGNQASVDVRKEEDPADFPRAIIDLMVARYIRRQNH